MRTLFIAALLITSVVGFSQIQTNAEEAFKISSETHKPVLLVFSGSDWCAPCIRFERKILQENSFIDFAIENIVLLKADFPQRKPLPKELQIQNDELAARYNPRGVFPTFLLLNIDRSVLVNLTYNNQSVEQFISEIKRLIE